jgi:2-(1,2-epoxy-1,2-dihydrophenyl)acetyl-CoA isomerase
MVQAPLRCEIADGIATLTLDEPARLNPLTLPTQEALRARLAQLADDREVRALVLTGAGRAFCVGADLDGMRADADRPGSLGEHVAGLMARTSNPLIEQLRALPIPTVAAVNGPAAGAGVGLALACDLVVAARSAYFYLPFVARLGIVPDLGTTWFLARRIGQARATALTLLGERLPAERAAQWGLIWSCVDDDALAAAARETATRLAALPPQAALETRRAYEAADANDLTAQLRYEAGRQRELIDRESFREGVDAFLAKRPPLFKGR